MGLASRAVRDHYLVGKICNRVSLFWLVLLFRPRLETYLAHFRCLKIALWYCELDDFTELLVTQASLSWGRPIWPVQALDSLG